MVPTDVTKNGRHLKLKKMWRAGFSEDSALALLGGSTAKKVPSPGMQPRHLCTLLKEHTQKKSF